jgi:predicted MFS family arabinose efflux permease
MPRSLVWLFAIASGLSVANVYYAQPLLDALARDFAIGDAAIGGVIAATQIGCAMALLLLVPLGDRVNRRRLMATQVILLIAALAAVSMASTAVMLLGCMLAVGLLGTAMTQGLIAYAASAAAPHEQGRVVGAAQSGVFIGLLLARVFSGSISDLFGWRGVYILAALLMLGIALPLWRRLPVLAAAPTPELSAPVDIHADSAAPGKSASGARRAGVTDVCRLQYLLECAGFAIERSALRFSHTEIGALGLVGVIGALAAGRAGKWADRGYGQRTSAAALVMLLIAWWPLSLMAWSPAALLVGIVLLDLGGQALHVTNQSMIFRTRPEAHSRLVGLYMLFYALGSGLGAVSTTAVYARAGWQGVCLLGASVSLLALLFWLMTRG